jgi:hypothetical protein
MNKSQIVNRFLFFDNSYLLNIKILTNAKNKEFIFVDKQAEIKIKLYEDILFFRIGNFLW